MPSEESGTVRNKLAIVYEDTESEVSSQIKAQRVKRGKRKKINKKNATKGPPQAITQSTIEVEEQKNGEIKDNKATSEISIGKKDNKDARNQSSGCKHGIEEIRWPIEAKQISIFENKS